MTLGEGLARGANLQFMPGRLLLLVMVLLLAAGPAQARKLALVVGINEYQDQQITPLSFACNDARLLAETLVAKAGFARDDVYVYTSDGPVKPTRGELIQRLQMLQSRAQKGDTLLVFFAGHGVMLNGEGYLLPVDAHLGELALPETALRTATLSKALSDSQASELVVLLDACRNDPSRGRGSGDNVLTEGMARSLVFVPDPARPQERRAVTIFACEKGQRSFESPSTRHGIFTYALAQAMSGPQVNLDSLMTGTRETMARMCDREALPRVQTPIMVFEGGLASSWVLTSPGASRTPVARPADPGPSAPLPAGNPALAHPVPAPSSSAPLASATTSVTPGNPTLATPPAETARLVLEGPTPASVSVDMLVRDPGAPIALAPGSHKVRILFGEAYLPYETSLELRDGEVHRLRPEPRRNAIGHHQAGLEAWRKGDRAAARAAFTQAATGAGKLVSETFYYLGLLAGAENDPQGAEQNLFRYVNLRDDSVAGHYQLGLVRQRAGKAGPAATQFKLAIFRLEPGSQAWLAKGAPATGPAARLQQAFANEQKGDMAAARDQYRSLLESLAAQRQVRLDEP